MKLTIVLLGKTGNGKSATGNTLLNMEFFEHEPSSTTKTRMLKVCNTSYKGGIICVVDTPPPYSTDCVNCDSELSELIRTRDSMDNLMNHVSYSGADAFFFVCDIGHTYNEEQKKSIVIFEKIFGPEVISTFGVLVFTHGDHFEKDFNEWCGQQTGSLRELIDKFSGRVVLISNRRDLNDVRNTSREALIRKALAIKYSGQSYTLNDYNLHERSRELLIFNEKIRDHKIKYKHKIDSLETRIESESSMKKVEANVYINEIKKIKDKINQKRGETNELDDVIDRLDKLEAFVNSKIASSCMLS